MGIRYEFASSTLLCAEDNSSILSFDDEEEVGLAGEAGFHKLDLIPPQRSDFYKDSVMGLPPMSDECMALLVAKETHHLPREDYAQRLQTGALEVSVRRGAIDWILKVHCYYKFGPLSAYLSINYLDRFLSVYELMQGKAWMTQLLSVACLSLSAKMEETEVPLSLDLQIGGAKYVFEPKTVQRMELLVLSTLKWKMQAVTPFSFIDYFLDKFNEGKPPTNALISRSVELILKATRGIEFLKFRPSEIAAAVVLSALGEAQLMDIAKALTCCTHVDKVRVFRCSEVLQEMTLVKERSNNNVNPLVSSVPQSPIGVLDAACLSYRSDDTTVGSHANSHQTSPATKRRKLTRPSIS